MRFLLDTNAVIALLKGHPGMLDQIRRYRPADFGLPSVVMYELYFGALKSQRRDANLDRIAALRFDVVPFDLEDAARSAEIRAALAKAGTPIGPYDAMIAGQALARNLTVVTNNGGEFRRVAELRIEDWL